MRRTGPEERQRPEQDSPVALYCLAATLADEAARGGFAEFARALEQALGGFLATMPREQQADALRISYEMALGGGEASAPRLRLVHSRD